MSTLQEEVGCGHVFVWVLSGSWIEYQLHLG